MTCIFKSSGRKVSDFDIAMLEKKIDEKFPKEYRMFLLNNNGGRPVPDAFNFRTAFHRGKISAVQFFLGIDLPIDSSNLFWAWDQYKTDLPEHMIPIASIGYEDDILCLALAGTMKGAIYYWDSSESGQLESNTNLYLISESIDILIEELYEFVPPLESELERIVRGNDVSALIRLVESGLDLEKQDEYGRTLIENAAINNCIDIIQVIFDHGGKLRSALNLAKENYEFFSEHKDSVDLLERLSKLSRSIN